METFLAEAAKVITIVLLTMLKFVFGPTLGYAAGYSYIITVLISITGMMISVFLFTYLGKYLSKYVLDKIFTHRQVFSKRSRRFVTIWKKYGEKGVAFLTPLILTPIGGTILLTSCKTDKERIIKLMLISAIFWSFFLTAVIYLFGRSVTQYLS